MKTYLAGPMRGLIDWNRPAFAAAKAVLEERGHWVFCPAAIAGAMGYGPDAGHGSEPDSEDGQAHLRHVILSDVGCLLHADAIALLPGWERSRGATVELALAQFLGLRIFDAVTMAEIAPPLTPWSGLAGLADQLLDELRREREVFEEWMTDTSGSERRRGKIGIDKVDNSPPSGPPAEMVRDNGDDWYEMRTEAWVAKYGDQ